MGISDRREEIAVLCYFKPIHLESYTVSIDNVVLDFANVSSLALKKVQAFIGSLHQMDGITVVEWTETKPGRFAEQYRFSVGPGQSFWLGMGLIGKTTRWDRCRIQFNPNKLGDDPTLQRVQQFLRRYSLFTPPKIARFDLAIDLPVSREKCFLVKDRRLYIERRHGQEFTQYLGAKSSRVGRVKLYNKAVEAGLDYPLTRLELTLDPAVAYEDVSFPKVFFLDEQKLTSAQVRATDTERFILNAFLAGCGSLNDLGRKVRAKIERLLKSYVVTVSISAEEYDMIIAQLQRYVNGSSADANERVTT